MDMYAKCLPVFISLPDGFSSSPLRWQMLALRYENSGLGVGLRFGMRFVVHGFQIGYCCTFFSARQYAARCLKPGPGILGRFFLLGASVQNASFAETTVEIVVLELLDIKTNHLGQILIVTLSGPSQELPSVPRCTHTWTGP